MVSSIIEWDLFFFLKNGFLSLYLNNCYIEVLDVVRVCGFCDDKLEIYIGEGDKWFRVFKYLWY